MHNAKEKIISITTQLIENNNGNIADITAREISEKAGVGLGLINYHFGSKENLITVCVQRIIENVIIDSAAEKEYDTDKARLSAWATFVFNFLFEHPAISRISILADMQNYTSDSNSVDTLRGFIPAIRSDMDDSDKVFLSFILTASMQVAFLGCDIVKELLGYDFSLLKDRAAYIEKTVSILLKEDRKPVQE
ncbi:TetR/AcrR family transcriptional regulator [Ohessyouella blattaphilus]|uniref:TetR/AcrR family transcriptional regulator n=1 Tax=Ohessyouella blattaphilus TaxID=2949333 RepID=A0ABT1EKZ2_9FIRM|nr:TetR/AcrR family transcriptional regulator [Ohessyouella blattaphilus]MCP1111371.1 TetR/AcrR family transcriptional regulator [Ohessyouella blattaphilus]MCR8564765.1 TetR/AcrR family transcriptional regulator [Ohessyouella blattaphilus]